MSQSDQPLIIGAGIAGLALHLGLKKHGIHAPVFEKSLTPRVGGSGIILAPNGLKALLDLGISYDEILSRGQALSFGSIRNALDQVIVKQQLKSFGHDQKPFIGIGREAVWELLYSRIDPNSIRWDSQVVNYDHIENKIILCSQRVENFEFQLSPSSLLFGCDGVNSSIRKSVFNSESVRSLEYISWRGIINSADIKKFSFPVSMDEKEAVEWWGNHRRVGLLPMGNGSYCWFCVGKYDLKNMPHQNSSSSEIFPFLLKHYGEFPFFMKNLIELIDLKTIHRHQVSEAKLPLVWKNKSVFLLGDAVHAMQPNLAQGLNSTLVDIHQLLPVLASSRQLRKQKSVLMLNNWMIRRSLKVSLLILMGRASSYVYHDFKWGNHLSRILGMLGEKLMMFRILANSLFSVILRWIIS